MSTYLVGQFTNRGTGDIEYYIYKEVTDSLDIAALTNDRERDTHAVIVTAHNGKPYGPYLHYSDAQYWALVLIRVEKTREENDD